MGSLELELTFILFSSLILGLLLRKLRISSVVAYIFVGLLLGPVFLNLLTQLHLYQIFGELGISFLLFIVGTHLRISKILKSNLKILRAYILATLILALTFFIPLVKLIGNYFLALILSIALTFSSTIVSVKLLVENKELESLHGILSLLILIFQDIVAAMLIAVIDLSYLNFSVILVIAAILAFLFTSYGQRFLEKILEEVSVSTEYLFLFAIGWMFLFSIVFQKAGMGFELGALVAGILLANTSFSEEIVSRLKPLQDFFLIFFFVYLGSSFSGGFSSSMLAYIALLSILYTLYKALIYSLSLKTANYSLSTSLYSGLYLSTTSEFTLVLLYLLSHKIPAQLYQSLLILTLLSLLEATLLIVLRDKIRRFVMKLLGRTSKASLLEPTIHKSLHSEIKPKYIIFGITKLSREFLFSLNDAKRNLFLIIDLNPEKVIYLRERGFNALYGDATDVYFLDSLDFSNLEAVISFIPDLEVNKAIASYFNSKIPSAKLIALAGSKQEEEALKNYGFSEIVSLRRLVARELKFLLKLGTEATK